MDITVDAALLAQLLDGDDNDGDAPVGGINAVHDALPALYAQPQLLLHAPLYQHDIAPSYQTPTLLPVTPLEVDTLLLEESDELLGLLDEPVFIESTASERVAPSQSAVVNGEVGGSGTSSRSNSGGGGDDSDTRSTEPQQIQLNPDSGATSATPRSSSSTTTLKQRRRRGSKPGSIRNPSRERLLDELEYLRGQVVLLEDKLQSAQGEQAAALGHDTAATMTARVGVVTAIPKWQRIAKRQLDGCERAVSENKRLRGMLALQRELVAGMEEKLFNWQHGAATQPPLVDQMASRAKTVSPSALEALQSSASEARTVRLEPGDKVVLEMLVSELDGMFAHASETFRAAGVFALPSESYSKAAVKTEYGAAGSRDSESTRPPLRSFVELVEVDVSPFEFEMTNRVAAICAERQSEITGSVPYTNGGWEPKRVHAEKCRFQRVLRGAELTFEMLSAMKEFAFDKGVVVVWRTVSTCEERFPGLLVQEFGWFMATPLPARPTSCTLERTVVHFEPKRFASPSEVVGAEGSVMTDLVMSAYKDDMDRLDRMMENMLLDESRKLVAVPTYR